VEQVEDQRINHYLQAQHELLYCLGHRLMASGSGTEQHGHQPLSIVILKLVCLQMVSVTSGIILVDVSDARIKINTALATLGGRMPFIQHKNGSEDAAWG
jgi:hypothetical protein